VSGLTTFIFIIAAGFWGAFLLILLGWASSTLWTFGVNVVREMRKPDPDGSTATSVSERRKRPIEIASDIAILESSLRPNLPWPPENWEEILDEFLYRYPNDWHENSHRLLHRSNLQTLSASSGSRQVACECMDYASSGGLAGPCRCGHSIQDHAAGICTIVTTVQTGNQRAVEQYINRRTRVSQ
jgi:hypothetical protein